MQAEPFPAGNQDFLLDCGKRSCQNFEIIIAGKGYPIYNNGRTN
jgi:hypothetical protein